MREEILRYMSEMDFTDPSEETAIAAVEAELNISFPQQYWDFMLTTNGAEGPLGENAYLTIWPMEEIVSLNAEYGVSKFTPGLLYFGSDGGGTAYAFDFRDEIPVIVGFPFDSIEIEDAEKIADTFEEFISALFQS